MRKRDDNIYSRYGIYGIQNLQTGMTYVGQTGMNFGDRWDSHRALLRGGKHDNTHLQADWLEFGEESFKFFIIEECEVDMLDEKEKFYISEYKESGLAYNIQSGGKSGGRGIPMSEDAKKQIAEKNREHMTGRHHSEETKRKMSLARKGKKLGPMSEEAKENIRKSHQEYAKTHPKKLKVEDVINIRELHSNGATYSELAKEYDVSYQCIHDICNYKRWKSV